jgi:site-specific recombinase XerD
MPSKLLLSHIKPHKPISSATLGRWLKDIISRAGIDTDIFKAHSVRGAAATSSFNIGIPLQDILKLADWSTDSTFRRFYYKPTNQPLVARSLLAGSHNSQ